MLTLLFAVLDLIEAQTQDCLFLVVTVRFIAIRMDDSFLKLYLRGGDVSRRLVLLALLADCVVTSTLPADVSISIVCIALSRVKSNTVTIIAHGLLPVGGARCSLLV